MDAADFAKHCWQADGLPAPPGGGGLRHINILRGQS